MWPFWKDSVPFTSIITAFFDLVRPSTSLMLMSWNSPAKAVAAKANVTRTALSCFFILNWSNVFRFSFHAYLRLGRSPEPILGGQIVTLDRLFALVFKPIFHQEFPD